MKSGRAELSYAASKGIEDEVVDPQLRKHNIRPGGYGETSATNRKGAWTN